MFFYFYFRHFSHKPRWVYGREPNVVHGSLYKLAFGVGFDFFEKLEQYFCSSGVFGVLPGLLQGL